MHKAFCYPNQQPMMMMTRAQNIRENISHRSTAHTNTESDRLFSMQCNLWCIRNTMNVIWTCTSPWVNLFHRTHADTCMHARIATCMLNISSTWQADESNGWRKLNKIQHCIKLNETKINYTFILYMILNVCVCIWDVMRYAVRNIHARVYGR